MALFSATEGDASILGGLREQTANEAIADWLGTRGDWAAAVERVGAMQGGSGQTSFSRRATRMPVIIENEYGSPAVGDAKRGSDSATITPLDLMPIYPRKPLMGEG